MDTLSFETKCKILQYIYENLSEEATWADFVDTHFFALGFSNVVVSGGARELAQGGIQLLESTFDELTEYASENSSVNIQDLLRVADK